MGNQPPRSGRLTPLLAFAAAALILIVVSQGGVTERACNCDPARAPAGATTLAQLSKESALRKELDDAYATINQLKAKVAVAPQCPKPVAAPARPAAGGSAEVVDAPLKPVTHRLPEFLDKIDPKQTWRPGNRAWSMSQTVRNHPADESRCMRFKEDDQFAKAKPLPAAVNRTLAALPLAQLYDPIANLAAFDEVEALKCDAAMPRAPLPPFTLAHKHMHHLSRYTMYFNILCWLNMEKRAGSVLDVSGSEPWLSVFDAPNTKVTPVTFPQMDVHDLSHFPANSYDWVMADQVMEHLRFPQQAMDQIYRVLKPGGRAIMTSCAANPVHMFHDYWRFTMDAFKSLSLRFEAMELCGSWGNGVVNAARSMAGQFGGEPGSMLLDLPNGSKVVDPVALKLAGQNEKDHAMTVWMIVRKMPPGVNVP